MKLTKEECFKALNDLYYASSKARLFFTDRDYCYGILKQLINEHFNNKFLDGEIELMISLLKRVEDELGTDITLLIDKLIRIQNTLPKEEGVVTCVEFEVD